MRYAFSALAGLAVLVAVGSVEAQALPAAPAVNADSMIVKVAGGCGPGWHRSPRGLCVRNWRRHPPVTCRWVRTHHGPRRICRAW